MAWEAWLTLGVVFCMFFALARSFTTPDAILWAALGLLILAGTITRSDKLPNAATAVLGMGNSGLVTIGFLFVLVEGLSRTGATQWISIPLLRFSGSATSTRVTLIAMVASASSMLNNTAIVAMFLPITRELSQRTGISPSKLFLPMCYAATLGGVCTLMGTSTNLVIDGLWQKAGHPGLGIFELSWVGIPIAVVGGIYLLIAGNWLPDRRPPINLDDDLREYSVEMKVSPHSNLSGRSIQEAGLRQLPGLFLAEIERSGEVIAAPSPTMKLQAEDRLVFVGIPDSVVDLRRIQGLSPVTDRHYLSSGSGQSGGRVLTEVVVADKCPLVGTRIQCSDFRGLYDAVVIAIARGGRRVAGKIGDVELTSGDCLLLETQADFAKRHRHNRDFHLVSSIHDSDLPRTSRSLMALSIMVAVVGVVGFGLTDLLTAAIVGSLAMLFFRCCSPTQARGAIEWNVLLVIGAALGLAGALQSSGAAAGAAEAMLSLSANQPHVLLGMVYLTTMITTELVTNNAAAAMMFPIALKSAESAGIEPLPLVIAVMVAASSSFATPFGYQTNMMVAGPGGYRFGDYVRLGLPLDLIIMTVAVILIPLIWEFQPTS